MKTLKKGILCFAAVGVMMIMSGCDEKSAEEDGRDAAVFFCNCVKTGTKNECFEKLKSKYSNYSNETFIETFNEENTCNATLYWVQE
jgi:hypothetical protein